MVFAAAVLFRSQNFVRFSEVHNIPAQLFVVHVEFRVHQLNGLHQFDVINASLFENLDIGNGSPRVR